MMIVSSPDAPAAIGPYSQAIVANGLVFCSGQIPLTKDGGFVDGPVEDQAEQVFTNIKAVLAAAGSSLDKVVKATVFLVDLGDFATVNGIYEKHFGTHKPARSTIQIAALPRGSKVEIEVIALAG